MHPLENSFGVAEESLRTGVECLRMFVVHFGDRSTDSEVFGVE